MPFAGIRDSIAHATGSPARSRRAADKRPSPRSSGINLIPEFAIRGRTFVRRTTLFWWPREVARKPPPDSAPQRRIDRADALAARRRNDRRISSAVARQCAPGSAGFTAGVTADFPRPPGKVRSAHEGATSDSESRDEVAASGRTGWRLSANRNPLRRRDSRVRGRRPVPANGRESRGTAGGDPYGYANNPVTQAAILPDMAPTTTSSTRPAAQATSMTRPSRSMRAMAKSRSTAPKG